MNSTQNTPDQVLDFWFRELAPKQWWVKSDELDRQIETRFGALLAAAERCELFGWRETAWGRVAEVIVLDQFSRNIYREQARAFANDALALGLAQTAVADGVDRELEATQQVFLYMPHMHSESRLIHAQAVRLFSQPGMENNLAFELKHKAIIERFGHYPHRNAALGRISTPEEIEFLKAPGSSF